MFNIEITIPGGGKIKSQSKAEDVLVANLVFDSVQNKNKKTILKAEYKSAKIEITDVSDNKTQEDLEIDINCKNED